MRRVKQVFFFFKSLEMKSPNEVSFDTPVILMTCHPQPHQVTDHFLCLVIPPFKHDHFPCVAF